MVLITGLAPNGLPCSSAGKETASNAGELGLIPGLGRSSGEGNSYHSRMLPEEFHGQRSLVGYSLSSVQSLSHVQLFAAPWIAARQASLSITNSRSSFTQTHVHRVGDAIQPSHPLSSPFPPAPNPSQHQSLFQWVNSSHEVAKVLEYLASFLPRNTQDWSPLEWTGWISLLCSTVNTEPCFLKHSILPGWFSNSIACVRITSWVC